MVVLRFQLFYAYWLVGQVITDYGGVERLTQALLSRAWGRITDCNVICSILILT